ncbi:hypothetical protein ACFX2I_026066 [Malus domestica]|uniref:mavicyanin-like n=1 Tax=Malus sylvestris TaxID=3752 RepID=UPI0010AB3E7A|nr:mavicyanin-like [Malus domestica]XP_050114459.1 mavicyanin-like [Malus sylvestris]
MARTMNMNNVMVLAIAIIAISVVLPTTEAALYTVGDELGWAIPPEAGYYAAWASKHSFFVNDILVFNFTEGEEDLAMVTKEDFDACNTSNPLFYFDEPPTLKFLASDTFYFTSTFDGHCPRGQKVAIYIAPSSATPPCPSPTAAVQAHATIPIKFVSMKVKQGKRS